MKLTTNKTNRRIATGLITRSVVSIVLVIFVSQSLSLFAQDQQPSSVSPALRSYNDPLRSRKVNKIRMIRDIARKDSKSTETQVIELPPREGRRGQRSSNPEIKIPELKPSLPSSNHLPVATLPKTRPSSLPQAAPAPQTLTPITLPEAPSLATSQEQSQATITPPLVANQGASEFELPQIRPSLPPSVPVEASKPLARTEFKYAKEDESEYTLTPTSRPTITAAETITVPSTPPTAFEVSQSPSIDNIELEDPYQQFESTVGSLDKDDYKAYFDAGWSLLQSGQQNLANKFNDLNELQEDRNDYLVTGMGLIAKQQDIDTTRLNEMEETLSTIDQRVSSLEGNTDADQEDSEEKQYMLSPKYAEAEETNETTPGTTDSSSYTLTEVAHNETNVDPDTQHTDYLIRLLEDIIENPHDYLFWGGYLPDNGPSSLRFASQSPEFNRRNLIPLTTPLTQGVDMQALFPQVDEIQPLHSGKEPTMRPSYSGNITALSEEEILRRLSRTSSSSNRVDVPFQVPHQNKPNKLQSPGSERIFK